MYLFYLKLLTYLSIFGRLVYNNLIFLLSLYPIKSLASVLFYFCHMTHQKMLFHSCLNIAYSYWVFGIMKLLLFGVIDTECQVLLDHPPYNILRREYFFNRTGL